MNESRVTPTSRHDSDTLHFGPPFTIFLNVNLPELISGEYLYRVPHQQHVPRKTPKSLLHSSPSDIQY